MASSARTFTVMVSCPLAAAMAGSSVILLVCFDTGPGVGVILGVKVSVGVRVSVEVAVGPWQPGIVVVVAVAVGVMVESVGMAVSVGVPLDGVQVGSGALVAEGVSVVVGVAVALGVGVEVAGTSDEVSRRSRATIPLATCKVNVCEPLLRMGLVHKATLPVADLSMKEI